MSWELVGVFLLPALTAPLLWLWRPTAGVARGLGLLVALALVALSTSLCLEAAAGSVVLHAFGGWPPTLGIVFVVDRLAALMLLLLALLLLLTLAALRPRAHGERTVSRAVPLLLLLTLGLNGAFLTGDLFNLFVMFELVLLSSYLLLQVPGSRRSLRAGFSNVLINLLASLLFFAGVGVLYGLCGSVNLATLAERVPMVDPTLALAALAMLCVAFATKTALVPMAFWLPATYPTPSAPVAAFFAGIMTKLGAYALLRTVTLLMLDTLLPGWLLWAGAVSALVGVLAALAQYELRRLLAFHSVSQMGYVVVGLGLGTLAGLAGALYFVLHHALVKSSLYLVADELERANRTRDIRHMAQARGALVALFFLAALTLAGLPPTSGFIAKLAVFVAGVEAASWVPLAALLVASLFTLTSMIKIWQFVFEPRSKPSGLARDQPATTLSGQLPLAGLLAASLLLAALAGPVLDYTRATAGQLLEPDAYIEAVRSLDRTSLLAGGGGR